MGPKNKCPECKWVGGDHSEDCLLGAEEEVENYGSEEPFEAEEEYDDELEFDED